MYIQFQKIPISQRIKRIAKYISCVCKTFAYCHRFHVLSTSFNVFGISAIHAQSTYLLRLFCVLEFTCSHHFCIGHTIVISFRFTHVPSHSPFMYHNTWINVQRYAHVELLQHAVHYIQQHSMYIYKHLFLATCWLAQLPHFWVAL